MAGRVQSLHSPLVSVITIAVSWEQTVQTAGLEACLIHNASAALSFTWGLLAATVRLQTSGNSKIGSVPTARSQGVCLLKSSAEKYCSIWQVGFARQGLRSLLVLKWYSTA